jgi:hypothetical protein
MKDAWASSDLIAQDVEAAIMRRQAAKAKLPKGKDSKKYYKDHKDGHEWKKTKEEDPNAPHYLPGHDPESKGRNSAFNEEAKKQGLTWDMVRVILN